jgi:hypothetical protein
MSQAHDKLKEYITEATLAMHLRRRGGFNPVSGIASKSTRNDTAFIDMIVEYNEKTGDSFMIPKAPLALRVSMKDSTLESALQLGGEALKVAFAMKGVELGRFKGAYSREDGVDTPQGVRRETYWMRYDLKPRG